MKIKPLMFLIMFSAGCGSSEPVKLLASPATTMKSQQQARPTSALPSSLHGQVSHTQKTPQDALQTLRNAGLAQDDDYTKAEFIPNSKDTMILATVRNAPCVMVFRHVKTANAHYWMPNQIDCSKQNDMAHFNSNQSQPEIMSAESP